MGTEFGCGTVRTFDDESAIGRPNLAVTATLFKRKWPEDLAYVEITTEIHQN